MHHVIGQFSTWIANADTKAGLLATATTVLGGLLAGQRVAIQAAFHPRTPWQWVALLAVCVSIASILLCVLALVVVLRPRVQKPGYSRYSWPSVARTPLPRLVSASRSRAKLEGWRTAKAMAAIAARKFFWLRVAVLSWAVSAVSQFLWTVIRP